MTGRPEFHFMGVPVRIPSVAESTIAGVVAVLLGLIASTFDNAVAPMIFAAAFIGASLAASGLSYRKYPIQTAAAMLILLAIAFAICIGVEYLVGSAYGV